MKIFLLLLLSVAVLSTNAQTITISRTKAPLEEVLVEIGAQGGFSMFIDPQAKQMPVDVNLRNATIEVALSTVLQSLPFRYEIIGKRVNVTYQESLRPVNNNVMVTGRVTDINDNPLRASVGEKGSSNGMNSDGNGFFKISVPRQASLIISHIGYESTEIKASDIHQHIILKAENKQLEEVVFNGYRTTAKPYDVGTSTTIRYENAITPPLTNPLVTLQAQVPGMNITQRGGLPGAPFVVQIRGQRSLGADPNLPPPNNPLFIIDGVPFLGSSESMNQRSLIVATSPFSTINPSDIERIDILRDANTTSIYGSQGANGVVLITTKKATPGQPSVSLNLSSGVGEITKAPDYMNTQQYIEMRNEALKNDTLVPNLFNAFDILQWSKTRSTDWKDLLIGGTARISNAYVRLAAGSEQTQFALGVGYNSEGTVFRDDHGKTMKSVNLNVNHASKDRKFEFNLATTYAYDKSNLIARDPTIGISAPPNAPGPRDSLGRPAFIENNAPYLNPLSYLLQPYDFSMERLTSGLRLNYKLTPYLNIRTNAGYTNITADELLRIPKASQGPFGTTGAATFGNARNRYWIIEPQLEFSKTFRNNTRFKAMAGISYRERTARSSILEGTGYTNDEVLSSINGATNIVASSENSQYRVVSTYAMFNVNHKQRYIFEATARRDGSSRFGPNRQFANFASAAAGWIFSKEDFFNQIPALSFGKLKISYGTTGNDQINDYAFLDSWKPATNGYQGGSFVPSRLANNDYRWELHRSIDIGIELGFLKDRIRLNAVFNQSRTSNQLIAAPLPTQTGFTNVLKNYPAEVQNRNIELELNTTNISNRWFSWTTSFNLTIQRNKLLKFPDIDKTIYNTQFEIGKSLSLFNGYRTTGIDRDTGWYRLYDQNGNPIPYQQRRPNDGDKVNLGRSNPDFFGGLTNTIGFKGWQISFLFQFIKQHGQDFIYSRKVPPGTFLVNQPVHLLNRWTRPGDDAPYQRYTQSISSPAYVAAFSASTSDLSFTDASFIRLKNISFSYNMPVKWISKIKMRSCKLYVMGQNLLLFTKYKGFDPETYTNIEGLPPLKIFMAGIQAEF